MDPVGLRENLQKEMGRTCISYRHPEDADMMGQIPGRTEESVDEGVDFWESPEHTVGDRLPGRAVLGDYSSHTGCEPVRLRHPLSSGRELGALLLGRGLFLHIEVYLSLKCCLNLSVPMPYCRLLPMFPGWRGARRPPWYLHQGRAGGPCILGVLSSPAAGQGPLFPKVLSTLWDEPGSRRITPPC